MWGEASLTAPQHTGVARLSGQVSRLRPMVGEGRSLAAEIRRGTIDRVMEKFDLELGLEALLRTGGR